MAITYNSTDQTIDIVGSNVSGTPTSVTSTTLTDTSKSWTTNQWVGRYVQISAGTGADQPQRIISANTATQLTVYPAWDTNPTTGSTYQISFSYMDMMAANTAGGWGVMTQTKPGQYVIDAGLWFGNSSGTATYFGSGDLQITQSSTGNREVDPGLASKTYFYFYNNVRFQNGLVTTLSNKWTERGVQYLHADFRNDALAGAPRIWYGMNSPASLSNTTVDFYGSKIESASLINPPNNFQFSTPGSTCRLRMWNSTVGYGPFTGGSNAVGDFFNTTIIDKPLLTKQAVSGANNTVAIGLRVPGTVSKLFVFGGELGAVGADNAQSYTARDLYTRGSANLARMNAFSGTLNIIDADTDVTTILWSGANNGGTINYQWSHNFTIRDSGGTGIVGAQLAMFRAAGTSVFNATTTSGGVLAEQIVTQGFWNQTNGSTLQSYNNHTFRVRRYGYQFVKQTRTVGSKVVEGITMAANTFVVASEATANAYSGISINWGTKIITVSGTRTIQELYDYTQAQSCLSGNMQYDEPITTVDGIAFARTSGWTVYVTGTLIQTGKEITGAAAGAVFMASSPSYYEDRNGAIFSLSGSTYYASAITVNTTTGATVAYIESGGTNMTYNSSYSAGSLTASGGVATGYAVYKINSTSYSGHTLVVRKYDKQPYSAPKTVTGLAITDTVTLVADSFVTLSEASAGALTSISVNYGTKLVTVTASRSFTDVYDYLKWSIGQTANLLQAQVLTTVDAITYTFGTNWNLTVSGASGSVISTTKQIAFVGTGALAVATSGFFEDKTGATFDVSGVTTKASRFTVTVVDNATSSAITGAIVAFVDSGAADRTLSSALVAGGVATNGSGIATGYAIWKVGATAYSTQKMLVGSYAYQWLTIPKTVDGTPVTETDRMSADTSIVLSSAAATAVSGVTVNMGTKVVNLASNTLSNGTHNLKVRQVSASVIDGGSTKGYMSFYTLQTYSDTGLFLRFDGTYYHGAWGWGFTNSGGSGTLKQKDSVGNATTITAITISSILTGTRVFVRNGAAAASAAWSATAAKTVGMGVLRTTGLGTDGNNSGGLWFECTVAGTTAGTEPTWPTTAGSTVTDGTVTWTCRDIIILNVAAVSTSQAVTYEHTGAVVSDRLLDIKLAYVSGVTAKQFITTQAIITATGISYVATQVDDVTYNLNGIDGSTLTEFSISGTTIKIYINAGGGADTVPKAYNWWTYLMSTSSGIRDQTVTSFTATDTAHYTFAGGQQFKNIAAVPVTLTGAVVKDTTGSVANCVDTTGANIYITPANVEVYAVNTGSGLTGPQAAQLMAIPTTPAPTAPTVASAVWNEALAGHTTAGTSGKKLIDISLASAPTAASVAAAVWDEALAGHATAGTAGKKVTDIPTSGGTIPADLLTVGTFIALK